MITAWAAIKTIEELNEQIDQLSEAILVLEASNTVDEYFSAVTILKAANANNQSRIENLTERLKVTPIVENEALPKPAAKKPKPEERAPIETPTTNDEPELSV